MGGDPQAILQQDDGLAWINSGGNGFHLARGLYSVAEKIFEEAFSNCMELCHDAELIIASRLAVIPGLVIARHTGARCIPAYTLPAHPTEAFPSILMPFDASLGGPGNRYSHIVTEQIYWLLFRSLLKRWRSRMQERNEVSIAGVCVPHQMIHGPGLLGASPVVVPSEKGDPVKPTGYWVLDNTRGWSPPAALIDFIAAGPPPICIGFGSMRVPAPERLAAIVGAALRENGTRAIVLTGWGALQAVAPDDHIFVLEEAPHAWLLPQMKMMMHHGGAGTTAACLRAGIPSVPVPFFADHMFWARRLCALGVAPAPIPLRQITAAHLASSIKQVSTNPDFAKRAADLAVRLMAEDGPGEAIRIIDQAVTS
ncbi:MAG: sterol 3beta-glucosyltransferase [Hyphomicrobiales bacterium]|nr:sterol 3beta-glucosyltransferase [Hyphomicrobiales bacterium]